MTSKAMPPIPTKVAKHRIHAYAEEVARRVGYTAGSPLQSIVEALGGTIKHHSPFGDGGGAPPSIEVSSANKFLIHIPSTTSPQRDRFTIAHELGHLFLHYPMVLKASPTAQMIAYRWVDENDPDQQRAEWEANWFAAGFLMPAQVFRDAHTRYHGNPVALAAFFDVSEQAVRVRGSSLGLV